MSTDNFSTTDYSDPEYPDPYQSKRDYPEQRDRGAYHRRKRRKKAQYMMANASFDEEDQSQVGASDASCISRHRPMQYVSDSEMLEDSFEAPARGELVMSYKVGFCLLNLQQFWGSYIFMRKN